MLELTNVINKMDLTDIYRLTHPNQKNIPFSLHLMELSPKLTTYLETKKSQKIQEIRKPGVL